METSIVQTEKPTVNGEVVIPVTEQTHQTDFDTIMKNSNLDYQFRELIGTRTAYCVGASDPIQESHEELIEGVRLFGQTNDLAVFVTEFLKPETIPIMDQFIAKYDV